MPKLISNLITLPDRVRKGDFVLNLSKGVTEPEKTLDSAYDMSDLHFQSLFPTLVLQRSVGRTWARRWSIGSIRRCRISSRSTRSSDLTAAQAHG